MSGKPAPPVEELEAIAQYIIKVSDSNSDRKISLCEFKNSITKSPEILKFLASYSFISKDDLRPNFGRLQEFDVPECDSDLECETVHKGKTVADTSQPQTKMIDPRELLLRAKYEKMIKVSPTDYIPHTNDAEPPESNLKLDYVYGYRCYDTRNNLRYNKNDDIVYHTAAVGVVLNAENNTQQHFFEHTSEIVSLAIHPNLIYFATGDIGHFPLISVWDSTTLECLARISGLLTQGISQLAFSPDGNYLAAAATDESHCVAIYDWDKYTTTAKNVASKAKKNNPQGLIATGQSSASDVLFLLFNPPGEQLIIASINELNFATFSGGVLKLQKGECDSEEDKQALLCAAFVGTTLVTGTFSGDLLTWKGRKFSSTVTAHSGSVNAVWSRPNLAGIITGGNDGVIIFWDQCLNEMMTISIAGALNISIMPKIRSICESGDGKILIGTRSGDIIEIVKDRSEKFSPGIRLRSHFRGKKMGLAVRPKSLEFSTLSSDGMFFTWDILKRRQVFSKKFEVGGEALAFANNNLVAAIGFLNGKVIIIDAKTYETMAARKDVTSKVNILKFSPNSKLLGMATSINIMIYSVPELKLLKKFVAKAEVLHFDFSEDSLLIQTTSENKEMVVYDIEQGKKFSGEVNDIIWETWTCPLGWPVQGINASNFLETSIYVVDRSIDQKAVAVGDKSGTIKLFKFPCPIENSSFMAYRGHSSIVNNLKFSFDGSYLISIEDKNRAIFQWKYTHDDEGEASGENIKVPKDFIIDQPFNAGAAKTEEMAEDFRKFEEKECWQKLELEITRSKVKGAKTEASGDLPDANVAIKYVHGYRAYDTRNNLKWTKSGSVLYHTGGLGVVLNPVANTQSFFIQHESDIMSLAIHSNGAIAATGEVTTEFDVAGIYIWNIETKDILASLKKFHINAVRHLRFSPNGSKLLSIGEDKDHSFALYDWMSDKIIASAKIDRGEVTACEFKNETEFVTCGVKHIKFWTVTGYNVTCYRGLIEDFEPIVSCAYAFPKKTCVTGSSTGHLNVWTERTSTEVISAHTKEIYVLQAKNNLLISGGADGLVIIWDSSFAQVHTFNMADVKDVINPCVRAVDVNKLGCMIIGTLGSEIIKHYNTGEATILMHGHYQEELWGLCVSPNGTRFVTCGGDKTVRIWTLDALIYTSTIKEDGRACDWSSNSNFIVLGTINGKIITLNPSDKLTTIGELQSTFEKQQWIEDIKISPNNQLIAFGAHMGVSPVEIMRVNEQGSDLQKFKVINIGLTSPLIHVDWDITSTYLVVNSEKFGLAYVNVPSGSVIESSASSNIAWYNWTCSFGYSMKGILAQLREKFDITSVCRSHSEKIVVTGNDEGVIKLYKYPCTSNTAPFKSYIGHSSMISKLRFLNEDKFLVSIGCSDKTVIVWTTELGTAEPEKDKVQASKQSAENIYDEIDTAAETRALKKLAAAEEERKARCMDMMTINEIIHGIKEPTNFVKPPVNYAQAPKVKLRLRHVYGYRSRDCKNNIQYLKDGSIVYHAATVGIVLDKQLKVAKFFNQHRMAILAIAFHPDGIKVATGDCAEKSVIYIWDTTTCSQIQKFQGLLEKGIKDLAYSSSGDYLAAIDMSDYHMLAIYDVNNAVLLASSKIDVSLVLQVAFCSENDLVTIGKGHFMYWLINNKSLTSRKGQFENKNSSLGCIAAEKNFILTGNALGELYLWDEHRILSEKQIHTKPIDCITIAQQIILTGGRDAKVNILDKHFSVLMSIDMNDKVYDSIAPSVRALSLDRMGKNLLVGTLGSEIYELNIDPSSKTVHKVSAVVKGHSSPQKGANTEMRGLAIFPCGNKCATVSEDGTLRVWNLATRRQEKMVLLADNVKGKEIPMNDMHSSARPQVVDIGPKGELAIIGFKNGFVRIIELATGSVKHAKDHFSSVVTVIRISPDENRVAIGAASSLIQVFDFPAMDSIKSLTGHKGSITQLDWSEDSQVLHSNATDNQLLFWNANTGKLYPNGSTEFCDEKWATWTCIYGWPVQSLVYEISTNFLACMRSHGCFDRYQLLASGDENGLLRIYRYPCLKKGAEYLSGKGHSSPISAVKFTQDDKAIVSVGLRDGCVFQWDIY